MRRIRLAGLVIKNADQLPCGPESSVICAGGDQIGNEGADIAEDGIAGEAIAGAPAAPEVSSLGPFTLDTSILRGAMICCHT